MSIPPLVVLLIFVVMFTLPFWYIVPFYVNWKCSRQRASRLLRSVLTPIQYHQFLQRAYVEIPSPTYPKRMYRIFRNGGPVLVKEDDLFVSQLCLVPVAAHLPQEDVVALHTLMIEADEETYLQKANILGWRGRS
jgi:hypothetical protein